MNADTFKLIAKRRNKPPSFVSSTQQVAFSTGIVLFHIGNIFLAAAVFIIVYQTSLWVGIIASVVIVLIVIIVVIVNIFYMKL